MQETAGFPSPAVVLPHAETAWHIVCLIRSLEITGDWGEQSVLRHPSGYNDAFNWTSGASGNPTGRLRRRSWWAIAIVAALLLLHQLWIQPELARVQLDAPVLNVSGRQRMLSQKLAKSALAMVVATDSGRRASHREELREVVEEWRTSHDGLRHGDPARHLPHPKSPRVRELFEQIQPHFIAMLDSADILLRSSTANDEPTHSARLQQAVTRIMSHERDFLALMQSLVEQFEAEARDRVTALQRSGWIVSLAVLGILLTIQLAIVVPAIRVTDRRFSDQQRHYRLVVESMRDGLVVHDARQRIVFVNQRFRDMTGYSPDELRLTPASRYLADCDQRKFDAIMRQDSVEGVPATDLAIRCRDGKLLETEATWHEILDGTQRQVLVVLTDISERKRAEERSRELLGQLAHVERLKTMGEMAASLAHEIHQPLGAIANYADGCLRSLKAGESSLAALSEPVSGILRAAIRAGEIIRRVRGFARSETRFAARHAANDLVSEVAELCRAEARRLRASLELDLDADAGSLEVDGVQIQQVLTNLVHNALEAMAPDEVWPRRVKLRTRSVARGASVQFRVSDTGPGIPDQLRSRIFDAFVTSRPEGTGLGLAISRTIVESHGGEIILEDSSDGETTFSFTVPRCAVIAEERITAPAEKVFD